MEKTPLDPVDIALQFVGNKDNPIYNNWFYGKEGVKTADCATFVSYCRFHGGMPLGIGDYLRGWASVPNAVKHYKEKGQMTDKPQRNDLVFLDFSGKKIDFSHMAIFVKDNGDGSFHTVEANTSMAGSQGMGGNTIEKTRYYTCAAFAHPIV